MCGGGARISGRGEGDGEDEAREGSAAVGEACILSKDVAQGEAAEGEWFFSRWWEVVCECEGGGYGEMG